MKAQNLVSQINAFACCCCQEITKKLDNSFLWCQNKTFPNNLLIITLL